MRLHLPKSDMLKKIEWKRPCIIMQFN